VAGPYTAVVRWRSRIDSAWEIETRHPDFNSVEKAAFIANGIGAGGFLGLRLERGRLRIELGSGGRRPYLGEVETWLKRPGDAVPPECPFARLPCGPADLSARGLDGPFEALRFRVLDQASGLDVRVQFVVDGRRERLRVQILPPSSDGRVAEEPPRA
jgi:hypothetical protein